MKDLRKAQIPLHEGIEALLKNRSVQMALKGTLTTTYNESFTQFQVHDIDYLNGVKVYKNIRTILSEIAFQSRYNGLRTALLCAAIGRNVPEFAATRLFKVTEMELS